MQFSVKVSWRHDGEVSYLTFTTLWMLTIHGLVLFGQYLEMYQSWYGRVHDQAIAHSRTCALDPAILLQLVESGERNRSEHPQVAVCSKREYTHIPHQFF
jgi:hypothetical protein